MGMPANPAACGICPEGEENKNKGLLGAREARGARRTGHGGGQPLRKHAEAHSILPPGRLSGGVALTEGGHRLFGGGGPALLRHSAPRAPHAAKHHGNSSAGGARVASPRARAHAPLWKRDVGRACRLLRPRPRMLLMQPLHARASPRRRLPSSSSSAVMDLERSVRVVLGALLGGGGAERKRDGILHFLSRNLRGVARCRCHFFSTAWISSYSRDEESHCCRILLRLRVEANFFMVSVAQSRGTGQAPARRGWWLPQARGRCPGSHSPQRRRVQVMSPGCACPPAATGDATAMKASRELNLSQAAGCLPVGLSKQL